MTNHHIDSRDFYVEIIVSKGMGKLTKKAENMLISLANGAIKKRQYFSIDDRNDCLQTGLLNLFKNWYKFNPDKSNNAFAYYTEIFKRGIAEGINELQRKKGEDEDNPIRMIYIHSMNDGDGMFNI